MTRKYLVLGLVILGAAGFAIWKNQQLQAEELAGIAAVNGRLELKRLDVATLYPGRVEEILVQEGDEVKINQPLARLLLAFHKRRFPPHWRKKNGQKKQWLVP